MSSAGPAELVRACSDIRGLYGAAACSIARVTPEGDALRFVASDGAGATEIVGVRMGLGRGIAGFVALSGQPLAVGDVTRDARFARDVAESTDYVPAALLAVPLVDEAGDVTGVLSVLDPVRDDGASHLAGRSGTAAELAVLSVLGARLSVVLTATEREVGLATLAGDDELLAAIATLAAHRDRDAVRATIVGLARIVEEG
ncbi:MULTISPECIES: GAF domain-containing protein [unclassified Nocardioides]|uniref:GAF domain-containing protein n=1 Tax=unclassified Nocardioides TaxID=2615069 RepID=UPI0007033B35|nr:MULTISPECIES: GAF domain-containing protein [unclassified Nocardioides]KRC53529.1 hypothetical protein ASE19_14440 [Nocardioides sp. Root79]KRC67995.1 hypothetical protein ASE20_18315 [Nocardioides sp. Root240]